MILKRFLIVVFVIAIICCKENFSFGQIPTPVNVDTISIINNKAFITWIPKNDGITVRYVIHRSGWEKTSNYYIPYKDTLGPIIGINNDHYTDDSKNPCDSSFTYTVQAINDFGDGSVLQNTDSLKTILLSKPILDKCLNTFTLRWTGYINMPPAPGAYKVFASTTGETGPFTEVGSTTATSFVYENPTPGVEYTFMIRAVNSDGTKSSSSCKKSITSYAPLQPDWVYLRYATVENNEHVKLEWTIGNDAPISKFKILRSTDGQTFDIIDEINHTGDFKPSTVFIDTDADFNTQSYFYQIRVCDSCGVDRLASENIARTIHLSGIPGITGSANDLSWNHYEGWDFGNSGIDFYKIFRKVNGTDNGIDDPLFPSETTYLDEVSAFSTSEGVFNYYIVAYEKDGNNGFETFKDFSISNEIEIKQETRAILPNAFTPGRPPNEKFKPILAFIDIDGYSLAIFNKWGQLVFITEDPSGDGWDGKFKGEIVPTDSYVYQLKYRTPQGQNLEKMGTVTVIR